MAEKGALFSPLCSVSRSPLLFSSGDLFELSVSAFFLIEFNPHKSIALCDWREEVFFVCREIDGIDDAASSSASGDLSGSCRRRFGFSSFNDVKTFFLSVFFLVRFSFRAFFSWHFICLFDLSAPVWS